MNEVIATASNTTASDHTFPGRFISQVTPYDLNATGNGWLLNWRDGPVSGN